MSKELRITVLGYNGTGKSNFCGRYVSNHDTGDYEPTIESSFRKDITVDGLKIAIDLHDSAWDEEYHPIRLKYLEMSHGIVICIPVDQEADFDKMEKDFIEALLRVKDVDRFDPIILAVTKMDLEPEKRRLDDAALQAFALKYGFPIMFTSAKQNRGVNEVMERLVEMCLSFHKIGSMDPPESKSKGKSICSVQ